MRRNQILGKSYKACAENDLRTGYENGKVPHKPQVASISSSAYGFKLCDMMFVR